MENPNAVELGKIPDQENAEKQPLTNPEKANPVDPKDEENVEKCCKIPTVPEVKLWSNQAKSWTLNFILPTSDEVSDIVSAISHFV